RRLCLLLRLTPETPSATLSPYATPFRSGRAAGITHIVTTCCTGFSAPGVDLDLAARFGFGPSVARTVIGFMGCHAAINALKAARSEEHTSDLQSREHLVCRLLLDTKNGR